MWNELLELLKKNISISDVVAVLTVTSAIIGFFWVVFSKGLNLRIRDEISKSARSDSEKILELRATQISLQLQLDTLKAEVKDFAKTTERVIEIHSKIEIEKKKLSDLENDNVQLSKEVSEHRQNIHRLREQLGGMQKNLNKAAGLLSGNGS